MNKTLISFATALIATSFAVRDENNEKTDRSGPNTFSSPLSI